MPRVKKAPPVGSNAPPAPFALDDAAARLLALDPSDLDGINQMRAELQRLSALPNCRATLKPCLVAAHLRLQDAPFGNTAEVLEDALDFVARAIALRDGIDVVPTPRSQQDAQPPVHDDTAHAERSATVDVIAHDADRALLRDFVTESREYLEEGEAALLALEGDPGDDESVNTVFRAFHTIKGTSAFLGLNLLSSIAHHAESLLSRVRDREIRCVGGYADLALGTIDVMREIVDSVDSALGGDGRIVAPPRYAKLFQTLENPEAAGIREGEGPDARPDARPDAGSDSDGAVADGPARELPNVAGDEPQQSRSRTADATSESSMRVRTERLDRLIDLVGELVIAQAMVGQDSTLGSGEHAELARKVGHAGKIVRELQDLSMSMRMVPLRPTFQKLARLVRDVAHRTGKEVDFIVAGDDTEIDRTMVDAIADPLVHMVRNAVDHGIERPDDRRASGKERTGSVRLTAYHAGASVVVELSDDGKGLDRERILQLAMERGLIESAKGMSDSDIFALIFAPGFSTAAEVTDLSGRGVGMDVVRRSIEALRGRVEITSEPGRGSTFRIRLPLTLAITDGMLVRVANERFIIPTMSIQVSFRPTREALSTVAGRGEMVMLRNELLPLIRLHHLLGVPHAIEDAAGALLVVVEVGVRRYALLVDELLGQQQVVAKSLGERLGRIPGVSGGAILGDGRVGLILDVVELIALSRRIAAPPAATAMPVAIPA